MKYLITGGAGFIGSHLAERLLDEGHSVTVIDDLSTGKLLNIAYLDDKFKQFCFKSDDLGECLNTSSIAINSDVIFHLAASVGMKFVVDNPIKTLVNNIDSTAAILREAASRKTRIVITSTSEVYGKQESPLLETDNVVLGTGRRWNYAISKLADEALALAYRKEKDLPITIARMFNVVGVRQSGKYGMVIPRMVEQALTERPLTIYGDGTQTRCFLPVQDAVEALILLSQSSEAEGEIVNVGSEEEISINELAARIGSLHIDFVDSVSFEDAYFDGFEEIMRRVPDVSKLKKLTGWTQKHSLKEAIEDVKNEIASSGSRTSLPT